MIVLKNLMKTKNTFFLVALLLGHLFLFGQTSFGQSIYVGAELNFTKDSFYGERYSVVAKERNFLAEEVAPKICKDCKYGAWETFTYPDGWWFQITSDTDAIEIKTIKTTVDEYKKKYKSHLDDIFLIMKKGGLKPDPLGGLSHIHIDYETAFQFKIIHFRNYFVHLTNHQGALELLGAHDENGKYNAKFLSEMKVETIEKFKGILSELDKKILSGQELPTIAEFIKSLPSEMLNKFVAINLQHKETMEIRPISSPKNSNQFIDTAAFLTGAIEYIKTVEGLIPLEELRHPDQWTEQEKIDSFHQFAVTQGKDSGDYKRRILKPEQIHLIPSENQKVIRPIIRSCPFLFL